MLILMRHGECGVDYSADPGLTTAGAAALRARAVGLRGLGIDMVVHSAKRRAVQSVEVLAEFLPGVPTLCCAELREISPLALDGADRGGGDAARAKVQFERWVRPSLLRGTRLILAHRNILRFFARALGCDDHPELFEEFGEGLLIDRRTPESEEYHVDRLAVR